MNNNCDEYISSINKTDVKKSRKDAIENGTDLNNLYGELLIEIMNANSPKVCEELLKLSNVYVEDKKFNGKFVHESDRHIINMIAEYIDTICDNDLQCTQIQNMYRNLIQFKKQFIARHVHLVVYLVFNSRYSKIHDVNELIQNANVGLIRAIDKWNPQLGYKLSTYAGWWIKYEMLYGISKQCLDISIPFNVKEKKNRIDRFVGRYICQNNEDPNIEDIMEDTGFSYRNIQTCLESDIDIVYFDKINDDGSKLEECIPDNTISPEKACSISEINSMLNDSISNLSEKEKYVVQMFFGLNGKDQHSYRNIGKKMKLSHERIRQICDESIKKMKKSLSNKIRNEEIDGNYRELFV